MSLPPRPAPSHVPTLTEIIELDTLPAGTVAPAPLSSADLLTAPLGQPGSDEAERASTPATEPEATPQPSPPPPAPAALTSGARLMAGAPLDEAQITQKVMMDVQRQIDGMLEYRLREAMAPVLARASEALVRELRQELSRTMRDVVSRAVAQELARQRTRS